MLASLRPRSLPVFAHDSPSQHLNLSHPTHLPKSYINFGYSQMEGSRARRYITPPPGSAVGPDPLEQRPSPQSRQRSWHHPYMHSTRAAQGPSPPLLLDSLAGPFTRSYDMAHHDNQTLGSRLRSPPPQHRNELLHAPPESRPSAASRADTMRRAQPLSISPLPAYPRPHDVERVGGIGPSRNRGRSSTLTLPHPDTTRVRGGSFIGGRLNSPSHGSHGGYDEPVPPPPRSWEDARFYRDPYPHPGSEAFMAHRQSPTLRPPSRPSPILFAAGGPNQDPQLHAQRRLSGQMSAKMVNAGAIPRGGQYRSRPGTPISPLNMESLSMEDAPFPSVSGIAVPLASGQQRSPADVRARGDYFGPGEAEWHRSSHMASEISGSPPSGAYISGLRHDPREYGYRAPGNMNGEPISPDTEMPRCPPGSYAGSQSHMLPGRGPAGAMPAHHSGMSRMELIERERHAMAAQHHGPGPGAFMAPGGPQEHGYQSEFAPQARMGSGGGYGGNLPQHTVPIDRIAHSRRRRRPPYSYSSMITQAIASSSEGRMTLREIYTWISSNFSGYPMSGPDSQGWQNTVRHNLSLGKIFIKKARTAQDIYDSCSSGNPSQSQAARGKGGWWTLHPVVLAQIRSGQRTHNDEFDDVERLVEMENAAASSGASEGSATMAATSSTASADSAMASTRNESLARHRSYSDSMDPNAAEQLRPGSSQQSMTAPVSHKESIGVNRSMPTGRPGYAPYAAQLIERKNGLGPGAREDLPSVLQPKADAEFEGNNRANAYGRLRGHTIAVHETPWQNRTSMAAKYETDRYGGDAYMSTRPPSKSVPSPRPLFQARTQVVEDVEMEPAGTQARDSSMVLQEARETLASTKQQQQQQHHHHMPQARRETDAGIEAQEGKGRMAIRDLLNS
ncbi:uncharacterized protein UBRO_08837 [Ustilago bromivora]|uniref:Fork-head domain-containing protein n=1 Tax=Ustilago bromivora TaxID=307758 RepID=A0A1K0HD67_9BASI|nr:uncharacterized protein UBRO_08837 [Ustilago bromivora]